MDKNVRSTAPTHTSAVSTECIFYVSVIPVMDCCCCCCYYAEAAKSLRLNLNFLSLLLWSHLPFIAYIKHGINKVCCIINVLMKYASKYADTFIKTPDFAAQHNIKAH